MTEPQPSSPQRLQVVLPAVVMFVFGVGVGFVVSWAATQAKQVEPSVDGAMAQGGAPMGEGPGPMGGGGAMGGGSDHEGEQAPQSPDEDPAVMRQRLALHEQLLAKNPEDVRLLRTVGNYQGLLGDNDAALATYAKAEKLARDKGESTQLVEILCDEGVSLAEKRDLVGAFAKLDEARRLSPSDTRSRLTAAVILMTRVMPSPPPGFDRKEAVVKAEALLGEVLAIEPNEPNATQMLGLINQIREGMARKAAAEGSTPAP